MMKWIIKHGLLLCFCSILLAGVVIVFLQEKIQPGASTWTALLLIYFLVLRLYSSYEYRGVPADGDDTNQEEVHPK
ncbi:hypothetical protein ACLM5H_11215 [Fredinandcohnia humi]